MESLVQKVSELYHLGDLEALVVFLKSNKRKLEANLAELDKLYSTYENVSLVTSFILKVRLKFLESLSKENWETWLYRASQHLVNFDSAHQAFDRTSVCKLSEYFARHSIELSKNFPEYAKRALYCLVKAFEKLEFQNEVTQLHTYICQLALMTKNLHAATPLLEQKYYQVDKSQTGVQPQHCFLFFYYLGSIALILKQYEKAIHFFELGITLPCKAAHSASLASFKKLVLIYTVLFGEVYSTPKFAASVVHRITRQLAGPYMKLATTFQNILFEKEEPSKLSEVIQDNYQTWLKDQNSGLVNQLGKILVKHKVKRLTKTYKTLSFQEIQEATGASNPQELILEMIIKGEIQAKVDEQLQMISFEEKVARIQLDQLQDSCKELLNQISVVEERVAQVSLDQNYLLKTGVADPKYAQI